MTKLCKWYRNNRNYDYWLIKPLHCG